MLPSRSCSAHGAKSSLVVMRRKIKLVSIGQLRRNGFAWMLFCFLYCHLLLAGGSVDSEGWQVKGFIRPPNAKPVISPRKASVFVERAGARPVHWEALHTFNPAAIVRNGRIYVLYRAEDDSGENKIGGHASRIGLAQSSDGIHFKRRHEPVLYPTDDDQKSREEKGGCEDPRVVEAEDGSYVMTYTQWNHVTFDTGVASSRDLIHWTKQGPIFAKAFGGKYKDLQYKSGAIVTQLRANRLVAVKIKNKYWMYWGEGEIHLATSDNLHDWDPVEDASGNLVTVLAKRAGRFDSQFPEVGAPPILTPNGIVVIYNGKNAAVAGDPTLAPETYSAGEALFAADDPAHLLARTDKPIFKPELPFERSGQYVAGTTFVEGLVFFRKQWVLYYGCADSFVGVAMRERDEVTIVLD
jgi:beta-1,2-mannosidase